MNDNMALGVGFGGSVARKGTAHAGLGMKNTYRIECFTPDGILKWEEIIDNLVTAVGLNEVLDKFWNGNLYTAAHFVGFTAGTPTFAPADTMASHGGWSEVVAYTEGVRQALNMGSVSSAALDNSANKATITVNSNGTVLGGAFISTNSTKNGTAGILIAGGAFAGGNKTVDSGESLSLTVSSTLASV